ncbi:nucleotidyltransferase family protein [Dehalobacterium formicoaceticum]|uniref:Nucleotidyltransferase domain-containing protein n=1 Tax=Dehalobacterium formicoaceticum TaxID=51515 RepID=A0ABT1Y0X5_9FIRM|nr:nucleotidyltransferase domain-containing protein [Dehalobacterium formicoaceticum]MCR6544498.1 nucleotidyltransferase domain-containing protein [Dehalobacterium formicoaceticum]
MEKVYTTDEIKAKLLPVFKAAPIYKAILFGSYAKGNPTRLSDIDIVIDSRGKIRGIDFFGVLEDITEVLDIPVDLIEASQIIDGCRIQQEIAKTGVVIYERESYS